MTDRAELPVPVRVRNRLMFALPLTTLCCLMLGGTAITAACAQDAPAAPAAQAPVAQTSLLITVIGTDTGQPVPYAAVRLDSETERPRSRITNTQGNASFENISDGTYVVTISAANYTTIKPQTIVVAPGAQLKIVIFLSPRGPIELFTTGTVDLLDASDYSISYTRNKQFLQDFPFDARNHQDLNALLLSVPGVAYDAAGNFFVRGDGAVATSTTLDGLLAPEQAQGRETPIIGAETINSFRAVVGNFAPEYTGNGMALNIDTEALPSRAPLLDLSGRTGTYSTDEDYLTFGTRVYPAHIGGNPDGTATGTRSFAGAPMAYVFSLSQRFSDNAMESPQSGNQTVSNYTQTSLAFAKFELDVNKTTTIDAMLNYSTGRTDIADRTGLPPEYAQYGQGYGFAGAFSEDGLATQQDNGKSDVQIDNNILTSVSFRHTLASGTKMVLSAGSSDSTLNLNSSTPLSLALTALPENYSTEYEPFVNNDFQTFLLQADFTAPAKNLHQFKYGAVYQNIVGNESYQFVPGSQIALDALHALDPRLAPSGGTTGGFDSLGYPVYSFAPGANVSDVPVLQVHRTGYYAGAYAQDTYKMRPNLTFNYGLRVDSYNADTSSARLDPVSGFQSEPGSEPSLSTTSLSPRLNGVLEFNQPSRFKALQFLTSSPTVARFGYNRLFSAPGMNQGDFIGNQAAEGNGGFQKGTPAQPEVTDQYDLNIERQVGLRAKFRVGIYSKSISNYVESEQLIPGLQSDMMAIFNQGNVNSNGTDFTFELFPGKIDGPAQAGIHAFLSYENSATSPTNLHQYDNLGYPTGAYSNPDYNGAFAPYVMGDQTDTLSFGIADRMKDGSTYGLSGYYGSGLYESAVGYYNLPVRENSTRQSYSQINLRYSTGPRFINKTSSIDLEVANLFDSAERIDYFGSFGGDRFQMGRSIFLSLHMHL